MRAEIQKVAKALVAAAGVFTAAVVTYKWDIHPAVLVSVVTVAGGLAVWATPNKG
jgi:hypothetical protein